MPSAQAQFKEEVTLAHRKALQALHDILADTATPIDPDDDAESDEYEPALTEPQRLSLRLRAAAAILRVKSPDEEDDDESDDLPPPSPAKAGRADGATHHEPEGNQHGLQDRHQPPLAPQASRLAPKRRRPLTPAEIKAAKAKATWESIARGNEAAYQDLLILRAKAQQQREAAAAAAAAARITPPPTPAPSTPPPPLAQTSPSTSEAPASSPAVANSEAVGFARAGGLG